MAYLFPLVVFPKTVLDGWAGYQGHGSSGQFNELVLRGSGAGLCQVLVGSLVLALEANHQLPTITPKSGCVISGKSPPALGQILHLQNIKF